MKAQRVSRGNLSTRGVGGYAMPWLFFHWEWFITHCTGGWLGPSANLGKHGKFCLHQHSIPRLPACRKWLYWPHYSSPFMYWLFIPDFYVKADFSVNVWTSRSCWGFRLSHVMLCNVSVSHVVLCNVSSSCWREEFKETSLTPWPVNMKALHFLKSLRNAQYHIPGDWILLSHSISSKTLTQVEVMFVCLYQN